MRIDDLVETYVTPETIAGESEAWLRELEPYTGRANKQFNADRAALLVVDMNRAFVDAGRPLSSPNARAIVPNLSALVGSFRLRKSPVLWIVQGHVSVSHDRGKHLSAWWTDPILEGTPDVELTDGLEPAPGEKVILKRRYSGFYQTDLELTLRNLEVTQVVVCGVLTHMCPYLTAMDAFMRDFTVFYPVDGTASLNRELHMAGLRGVAGWCGRLVRCKDL